MEEREPTLLDSFRNWVHLMSRSHLGLREWSLSFQLLVVLAVMLSPALLGTAGEYLVNLVVYELVRGEEARIGFAAFFMIVLAALLLALMFWMGARSAKREERERKRQQELPQRSGLVVVAGVPALSPEGLQRLRRCSDLGSLLELTGTEGGSLVKGKGAGRWVDVLARSIAYHRGRLERVAIVVDTRVWGETEREVLKGAVKQMLGLAWQGTDRLVDDFVLSIEKLRDVNDLKETRCSVSRALAWMSSNDVPVYDVAVDVTLGNKMYTVGAVLEAAWLDADVQYVPQGAGLEREIEGVTGCDIRLQDVEIVRKRFERRTQ